MNFNHLFPKFGVVPPCPSAQHNTRHYWRPTGTITASLGDNIREDFYCKYCNKRESIFLDRETYHTHENILTKELNKEYNSVSTN